MLELVAVEVEVRGAGEILDREDRAQGLFEAGDIAGRGIGAEELLIAFALNLDEVRHFADFVDVAENLADAARVVGPGHGGTSFCLVAMVFPALRAAPAGSAGLRLMPVKKSEARLL